MDRRAFGRGAAACLLLAAAGLARAQPPGRVFRVGFLANHIPLSELPPKSTTPISSALAFVEGMKALGWHDGQNVRYFWRSAQSQLNRHPQLVDELIRIPVDVIVSFSEGAEAAAKATKTIPIVTGGCFFIVESGLAQSLARPGGNFTGLQSSAGAEFQKTAALLKEAVPGISRAALIAQRRQGVADGMPLPSWAKLPPGSGLDLFVVTFDNPYSIDKVVRSAAQRGAQALLFEGSFALYSYPEASRKLNEEAVKQRLPVMHAELIGMDEGGLMAYGIDSVGLWRRVPYYVDRILRGDKPGDIPIEQPAKVEFHINLKVAKAIGMTIPPALLLRADKVIQ